MTKKILAMIMAFSLASVPVGVAAESTSAEAAEAKAENDSFETDTELETSDEEIYDPGEYLVGTDIPAGEYSLDNTMGLSLVSHFKLYSNAEKDETVFENIISSNYIVNIEDGQLLEFEYATALPLSKTKDLNTAGSGMFKVGYHIDAGTYTVCSSTLGGICAIYDPDDQKNAIDFDLFTGMKEVTVEDGQYLLLSECYIDYRDAVKDDQNAEESSDLSEAQMEILERSIGSDLYNKYINTDSPWEYLSDEQNKIPTPDSCIKGLKVADSNENYTVYTAEDPTVDIRQAGNMYLRLVLLSTETATFEPYESLIVLQNENGQDFLDLGIGRDESLGGDFLMIIPY